MGGTSAPQNTLSAPSEDAPAKEDRGRVIRLLYRHPSLTATVIFILMLSGPPRLRYRDLDASLRGDADWVVFFHIGVWGFAGSWVLAQIYKRIQAELPLLRTRLPLILGIILVFCLALSIFTSDAPSLTAFKVYQILVSLLFTQLFVERFGAHATLRTMLWGNALLCIAIAICAFVAPDMVWTATELNPDPARISGDLIAPTGVVSVLAIILLLTSVRRIWKAIPLSLLGLFFSLLVLSLMRAAYITAFVFFALVIFRRPSIKPVRRLAYSLSVFLLILYACDWLPSISQYRSPETISTLSDRTGLWGHLAAVTLDRSPWLGLGYYSASRIHGPEHNPLLGTAHSMFIEVLAGGGLLSLALFLALCATLSVYVARLLYLRRDRLAFAFSTLFIACLVLGFMGETIDSGPLAIAFWCSASVLSRLHGWPLKRQTSLRKAEARATA